MNADDIDPFAIVLDQRNRLLSMLVELVIRCEFDGVPNDSRGTVDAARALISELSGKTS
jgi:hypothetical protein